MISQPMRTRLGLIPVKAWSQHCTCRFARRSVPIRAHIVGSDAARLVHVTVPQLLVRNMPMGAASELLAWSRIGVPAPELMGWATILKYTIAAHEIVASCTSPRQRRPTMTPAIPDS